MIDILCPLITKGDIRGEYWVDKNDLNNTYAKADLTLCQKSLTNQKKSAQWWLCLFTTGFCDVGKMLLKYKYQTHISCPWRRERDEDMFNVLCCADQGTVAIWNGKIHKLQVWMKSQEPPPLKSLHSPLVTSIPGVRIDPVNTDLLMNILDKP